MVVFADISNPNTSISKIFDLIRPVDEWSEIAFLGRQNVEKEHCETLKKLVHKLNLHNWTCLYKTLHFYSCITTLANLVYIEKELVLADISNPNTSISKIIDLIRPVVDWAEITFSTRQNTENEHTETLKKVVHKLSFHH